MTDLWSAFSSVVDRRGDQLAVVQGDHRVSFQSLQERARVYAAYFHARRVEPGDRILVWMQASAEMAAALLGGWSRGAVMALMDPEAKADHLGHAVRLVSPKLIVRAEPVDLPADVDVEVVHDKEVRGAATPLPRASVLPTDPASIVFTSGSTGKPKGVTQSHGNLINGCDTVAKYLGYREDDRICCPIPWFFDYGFGQLLSTIRLGLTHVLPTALTPFAISDAIEQHKPSVFPGIPSLFAYLVQGLSPFSKINRSSIRLVTNTGGTIPDPVLDQMIDLFEGRADIVLNYGLTETYRSSFLSPSLLRSHRHTIGRPMPGVDVVIVREDGSLASQGEEGQIVHRGICVCMGYWGDRESTQLAIRHDPVVPSERPGASRAFYTGDLGLIDEEGFLRFRGRRDHMIKTMGVRVSPSEVESQLYGSDLVSEVAVYSVKHDLLGDEIFAAVVLRSQSSEIADQLKTFCRQAMSQYMVPRRWVFADSLPRTPGGKIDYVRLKASAARSPSVSFSKRRSD